MESGKIRKGYMNSPCKSIYNIPSWLLPIPRKFENAADDAWNLNQNHSYSRSRADEELSDSFGVDIRTGAVRDWNEELQLAREMPTSNLIERVERARLIHKVLTEFGEASLLGVQAIASSCRSILKRLHFLGNNPKLKTWLCSYMRYSL